MSSNETSNLLKWISRTIWMEGADLESEKRQATEEGRDLSSVEADFSRLLSVPKPEGNWAQTAGGHRDEAWIIEAQLLVDRVQSLPICSDFPYDEPSDLPGIHAGRPDGGSVSAQVSDEVWRSKLAGGLFGRICGCLLGKPVEGWKKSNIEAVSKQQNNWPLRDYFRRITPDEETTLKAAGIDACFGDWNNGALRGEIVCFPEDDDINYTAIGFAVLEQYGKDFSPLDVATKWCCDLPILHTCTAERVAYRNFVGNVLPPESASKRNPYREWIGAQIRADYFGYANPGNPERAAEWAWRDASISHQRNGIYGEMWVAAMLASAYLDIDMVSIIRAGLGQVPSRSRFSKDVSSIVDLFESGAPFEDVLDAIHSQWDESNQHCWCHTNSNAQVVTAALLYGGSNYSKTIAYAVMAGFDTDCNGATAGSVWGIRYGLDAIPEHWITPLNDRVKTGVAGYQDVSISELAAKMYEVAKRNA